MKAAQRSTDYERRSSRGRVRGEIPVDVSPLRRYNEPYS